MHGLTNSIHTGAGNKDLCGKPLPQNCKSPQNKRNIIIIVVVVGCIVALAVIAAVSYARKGPTRASQLERPQDIRAGGNVINIENDAEDDQPPDDDHYKKTDDQNMKLYFVRNDDNQRERFELQDLLKSSAEVLGSGSFGSSYKAVILNGKLALVVKRFKQMNNVSKEQFREHMVRLGRLSHTNVLSLVAFCCRKEEKLLVSGFVPNGSLASHLHSTYRNISPFPKFTCISNWQEKTLKVIQFNLLLWSLNHFFCHFDFSN